MSPLDEALRAPAAAVSGRSGARQGGREQSAGEPGAFENAVADAGRQKPQGQGASVGQDADGPAAVGRPGAGILVATDAIEASARFGSERAASEDQSPHDTAGGRQKAMTRLQHLAGSATRGNGEAAGKLDGAAVSRSSRHPLNEIAATGETLGGEMAESGPASAEPAGETVSDLLTLLGGGAQTAATMPAEGRAARGAGDRTAAGLAGKVTAEKAAASDHDLPTGKRSDEAGSDRLFRFARADGKGQAVSMTISKDGERAAVENSKSSGQSRAEAVTVLEARRYLGVAMNANASSVAGAIAGDGEWARALQSGQALTQPEAWGQAGKTLNTLKIQMHPIDLGMVTATLRLKDDELHVELKVETGEAFRQLREDQSEMVKALRAQGFAVDQVNITFNGGDSSNGGGSQPQAQAGQPGRERAGEGGGQGQQRQDGGKVDAAEGWTGNDGADDAPIGAERPGAGYVYM